MTKYFFWWDSVDIWKIFPPQFFENILSKYLTLFTEEFYSKLIWRNIFDITTLCESNFSFFHTAVWNLVKIYVDNYRHCIFGKIPWIQSTPINHCANWFHGIFFVWRQHSVEKTQISWHQVFSNFYSKSVTFTKFFLLILLHTKG